MNKFRLEHAELNWRDEQPESTQFGDIYFSVEDGVAETNYVFIDSNDLPERWSKLPESSRFTIGETGFGTGLNLLCARKLWLETAPQDCRLQFISCEKYPMRRADLQRALSRFENISDFKEGAHQIIKQWPAAMRGIHKLSLDHGRIELWLLFGDAAEQFQEIEAQVDAWFLDGFAPSKNPEMWNPELFQQIARLSHSHTTCATFTSAGIVKRGLAERGFAITKTPGYGRKREMIRGKIESITTAPEFRQPWLKHPPKLVASRIAVIGAGLAGASTAHRLAESGFQVDLFERAPEPAQGGSGNPQGALYAKLPAKPTPAGRFHALGLQYSINWLRRLKLNDGQHAQLCGVLQLAVDPKEVERQQQFIDAANYPNTFVYEMSAEQASETIGSKTPHSALFFPEAGWASPPKLISKLLDHPNITKHFSHEVKAVVRDKDQWTVSGSEQRYSHIIITTAYDLELINSLANIELKPIRGQTTWVEAKPSDQIKSVVCGAGYISPALNGQFCFGASFKPGDRSSELRDDEHVHNFNLLESALPKLKQSLTERNFTGRVSHRAGSRDYLPMIGTLCKSDELLARYQELSRNAKAKFEGDAPWLPGLMVNVGHGSKGLVSCPIAAEMIAAEILGTPNPIDRSIADVLSPQRFQIRDLIRSQSN